ncbi:MAG: hypothetical protein LBG94_07190 [Treponema sp.]|jgi:tetratricopeptide (TPR) repeat protein|nr:hypothetical protein [Treponema sp.]
MKKIKFLSLWFILFLFTFPVSLFAQNTVSPWWLSLEYGKQRFRSGDYGNALLFFEDARRDRRAMYEQMERDLINLLSIGEVRRIGDSLDRVEQYSYERRYTAASAAFEELYYRIPKTSLNNSASAALGAIGKLKDYPEAEYWIGEVYRVEGELPLALSQYRRAFAMRENLEDSGFGTTLQYKIAGVLKTRMEYNEMERTLLSIITSLDTLWVNASINNTNGSGTSIPYAQASASFARVAMTRTLETDGVDRFLEMYRYNNSAVEQAHRLLGFHYVVAGRPSAQDHLMFAFLIQNTVIIEELMRRQFDFRFTTVPENRENQARNLVELSEIINRNPVLVSYIEEVEYYKTAYYLAASLYRNGRTSAALNLWSFLAAQPRAGEWYGRAINQLRNPHTEPIVEMP